MTNEPLVTHAQTEMRVVENPDLAATQQQPSDQQQQAADEVFSREQQHAVAALLALQMGVGLLHNCALEASRPEAQPQPPPRKERPEDEES